MNSILEQKPKLSKTDLAFSYDIDNPSSVIAFKNVRVLTMNKEKDILEGVTILIRKNKIVSIGDDVRIPKSAKVYDLEGRTVMPGMFDAHRAKFIWTSSKPRIWGYHYVRCLRYNSKRFLGI